MIRNLNIVSIALLILPLLLISMPSLANDQKPAPEIFFVQTAGGMKSTSSSLTLNNITADLIWMTERPFRQSGQISIEKFLEAWSKGADSFDNDPPNAVLTLKERIEEPIILEITNPRFRGDQVTYDIKVIAGLLPPTSGQVSMLIDSNPMVANGQIID